MMGLLGILVALGAAYLARLSRLEHPPISARRGAYRGRFCAGAAARQLDPNVHGKCGSVSGAVLSVVPARCAVWQAHGRQRVVRAISRFMSERLGPRHAILAVVLAGAMVTYGGVSLFVAFFVLAPMAQELFRAADIPRRLMPAAIVLGTSTFTMSALPGTPASKMRSRCRSSAPPHLPRPGLGIIASAIMLGFGLWWLRRAERQAKAGVRAMAAPPRYSRSGR